MLYCLGFGSGAVFDINYKAEKSGSAGAVIVGTNDTYVDPASATEEVTMAIYDLTRSSNCAENSTYSLPSGD